MAASRKQRKSSVSGSSSQQLDPPTGCLSRCQFESHAALVMSFASTGNLELLKHCSQSVCSNTWNIRDSCGRNVLLVAASCGHLDIVLWLLRKKGRIKIELTDNESRWNALHRAAYMGYAGILFPLVRNGMNLEQLDFDKLSPLNILHYNLETIDRSKLSSSSRLYVWGTNSNMTLGHDHVRTSPELLELSNCANNVTQAVICKFHSVFLSEGGEVYTCGHGQGGRLGHGNDKTCLAPKLVQGLKNEKCVSVAAARDHTVFLTESGVVYTCGLNDAHQLGQTPKNYSGTTGQQILPFSLAPFYLRSLKGVTIKAIGAGRYHTAVCTEKEVYTCGKNLGQLGYTSTPNETQIQPKMVTGIHIDKDDCISHFSVSDAATACLTKKKRLIYVCAKYTVHRCERLTVPETLSIAQFVICASLGTLKNKQQKKKEQSGLGGGSSLDASNGCGLTIGLTDSSNRLWMTHWMDFTKKSCTSPQLVPGSTKRNVAHFAITKNLSIVTPQGEVFTKCMPDYPEQPSLLGLKRVSSIQQAQRVFTDYKTNNMAVIQKLYSPPVFPKPEKSSFDSDIYSLLYEDSLPGPVFNVTFNVMGTKLTANKLVLSSQSKVFSTLFKPSSSSTPSSLPKLIASFDRQESEISLLFSNPKLFELFLQYLYGGNLTIKSSNQPSVAKDKKCTSVTDSPPSTSNSKSSLDDYLINDSSDSDWNSLYDRFGGIGTRNSFEFFRDSGFDDDPSFINTKDKVHLVCKKSTSPVGGGKSDSSSVTAGGSSVAVVYETNNIKEDLGQLKALATAFRVDELMKRVDSVVSSHTKPPSCTIKGPQLCLKAQSAPHDLVIVSESGTEHLCHKCVLVSRSDYFQSMLLMGWKETTSEDSVKTLNLPMSDELIEMVQEYLYTDRAVRVQDSSSLEWLTRALTTADQLLLKRLKTICELSLAKIVTMENVGYIIDLSEVYSAEQLLSSCVQFVCLNLPALLEMGGLEGVSESVLGRISEQYREMFPEVSKRKRLSLKELSADEIPLSYLSNVIIDSPDDEIEENVSWRPPSGAVTTPITRVKSPLETPTPSGSKTTPTSSGSANSSRKKRRKKGSGTNSMKSDIPRQLFSPEEIKNKQNGSKKFEQLDKVVTELGPRELTNGSATDSGSRRKLKIDEAKKRDEQMGTTPQDENIVIQNSPVNDNEKKRPVATDGESTVNHQPPLPPWGIRKSCSLENATDSTSFKEIMEIEETRVKKPAITNKSNEKKKKKPLKQSSQPLEIKTNNSSSEFDEEREVGILHSKSLPTGRSPTSPWGMDVNQPFKSVSLKTLMAEAEAEDQEIKRRNRQTTPTRTTFLTQQSLPVEKTQATVKRREERRASVPPPLSTSPIVSFSDIVTHQQHELDVHLHNQSHRKQFQLIQIEEQAIQKLLLLYNSSNNPNEYVSVERIPVGVVRPPGLSNSSSSRRTSAPYTGTQSAWNKKNKF